MTPIWEGTTNILSLDVLRAIAKTKGQVLVALNEYVCEKLDDSSMGNKLKELLQDIQNVIMSGQVSDESFEKNEYLKTNIYILVTIQGQSNYRQRVLLCPCRCNCWYAEFIIFIR